MLRRCELIQFFILQLSLVNMTNAKTLNVQIKPTCPHDPSEITTMADYDTMLIMYRVWFKYADDRTVLPGLINKWTFNEKGFYEFEIDKRANWSDGSPITSKQLIFNLDRLRKKKSNYAEGIASIIEIDKTEFLSNKKFRFYTKSKKPSADFFERMAAAFLAIVHPNDVNKDGLIKANTLTSGPYKSVSHKNGLIEFKKNDFDFLGHSNRAEKIVYNTKGSRPSNKEFITGDTWVNIIQTSTLMDKELGDLLLEKKLPYWTRSHDRVSHIFPLSSESTKNNKDRLEIMKNFRSCWNKVQIKDLHFNVKKAYSMQPEGYPLFHGQVPILKTNKTYKPRKVTVGAAAHRLNYFQQSFIERCFKEINITVDWKFFDSYSALDKEIEENDDLDFKLANYGVADPQPTTWMGLTFSKNLRFINFTGKDLDRKG